MCIRDSAGIVDEVIPEPLGGAQRAHQALFQSIDLELRRQLAALDRMGGKALACLLYTSCFAFLCKQPRPGAL